MPDVRQLLREKFAGTHVLPAAQPSMAKGKRRRVTFRVDARVDDDLAALKLALGRTVHELAEEILANGVAEKVAQFKSSNPGEWDVIRRLAAKR